MHPWFGLALWLASYLTVNCRVWRYEDGEGLKAVAAWTPTALCEPERSESSNVPRNRRIMEWECA